MSVLGRLSLDNKKRTRPIMPEDFSKIPVQLAERRMQQKQDAAEWSPREALLSVLRDIDAGLEIEQLIICYDGIKGAGFRNCTTTVMNAIGLLQVTQLQVYEAGRQE